MEEAEERHQIEIADALVHIKPFLEGKKYWDHYTKLISSTYTQSLLPNFTFEP